MEYVFKTDTIKSKLHYALAIEKIKQDKYLKLWAEFEEAKEKVLISVNFSPSLEDLQYCFDKREVTTVFRGMKRGFPIPSSYKCQRVTQEARLNHATVSRKYPSLTLQEVSHMRYVNVQEASLQPVEELVYSVVGSFGSEDLFTKLLKSKRFNQEGVCYVSYDPVALLPDPLVDVRRVSKVDLTVGDTLIILDKCPEQERKDVAKKVETMYLAENTSYTLIQRLIDNLDTDCEFVTFNDDEIALMKKLEIITGGQDDNSIETK